VPLLLGDLAVWLSVVGALAAAVFAAAGVLLQVWYRRPQLAVRLASKGQVAAEPGLCVGFTLWVVNTGDVSLPQLSIVASIQGEAVSDATVEVVPVGDFGEARLYFPMPEYAGYDGNTRTVSFPRGHPVLHISGRRVSRRMSLPI